MDIVRTPRIVFLTCDDGNLANDDECSRCTIDDGFSCSESDTCSPSTCSEVWGDGKKIGNNFKTKWLRLLRTNPAPADLLRD